jgi:hypothetical protein
MDMLSLMHENDRRGYLQVNGKPVTAELLARMTGGSTDEVSRLLQELEDSGVYSRTEDGCIYSRRMVRDEHKRALCAEAGRRGGGNPAFQARAARGNGAAWAHNANSGDASRNGETFKGLPKGHNKGRPKGTYEDEDAVNKRTSAAGKNWSGDDLAHHLLREIGIVPLGDLAVVVAQALALKAAQSGWTMERAFTHMLERATAARTARYRGKWIDWFAGGDYDKPAEAWQDVKKEHHMTETGQKIDRGYIPLKKLEPK